MDLLRKILTKCAEVYRRDGLNGLLRLPATHRRNVQIRRAQVELGEIARTGASSESKFSEIYRRRLWAVGSPTEKPSRSLSGHGSTDESTKILRPQLEELLQQEGVSRFLDAPCGDFEWIQLLRFPADCEYIGGDIVRFVIEDLSTRFGAGYVSPNGAPAAAVSFIHLDLTKDLFPPADAWLCKDCFQHLSLSEIASSLRNFARSDVKIALISNHQTDVNAEIATGDFRYLDLTKAPFFLPAPFARLQDEPIDGEPRYVGVWRREDVIEAIGNIAM